MVSGLHSAKVTVILQTLLTFDDVADLDKATEMVSKIADVNWLFLSLSRPRTPVEF